MKNYEELQKTNSNTTDYRRILFDFNDKYYLIESSEPFFIVKIESNGYWIMIARFIADIESSKEFLINRALDEINTECCHGD